MTTTTMGGEEALPPSKREREQRENIFSSFPSLPNDDALFSSFCLLFPPQQDIFIFEEDIFFSTDGEEQKRALPFFCRQSLFRELSPKTRKKKSKKREALFVFP